MTLPGLVSNAGALRCRQAIMARALLIAVVLAPAAPVLAQQPAAAPAPPPALPAQIPLFPLPDVVLMPNVARPLFVFESRYLDMVEDAMRGDQIIGMIELQPGFEKDYEGRPPIYGVGCAGKITDYEEMIDGRYAIVLRCFTKFRVKSEEARRTYRVANVEEVPDPLSAVEHDQLAVMREKLEGLMDLPIMPLDEIVPRGLSDEAYVNSVAMFLRMRGPLRQELLELGGPVARAQRLLELIDAMHLR